MTLKNWYTNWMNNYDLYIYIYKWSATHYVLINDRSIPRNIVSVVVVQED